MAKNKIRPKNNVRQKQGKVVRQGSPRVVRQGSQRAIRPNSRQAVRQNSRQAIEPSSRRVVRPSWNEYFLNTAKMVASRSTCDRRNVGAIIVKHKAILSTGYNGAPRGMPHCDDVGHEISDGHCIRTVHAEANAIAQAARHGAAIDGASIYLTHSPCYDCFKMVVNAGIAEVVYDEFYSGRYGASRAVLTLAKKAGVKITNKNKR